MPRKTFVAGEVLAAADVNEFLANQVVMTFAGTAARGSAIASPVEGMVTYLEDDDQLEVYGGTAVGWSSASNFIFGTAVPTDGQVASYSTAVSGWVPADASTGAAGTNLLYNGAMQVAQRGTSDTGITSDGYYTADRWKLGNTSLGTWTQTIESDGPSAAGLTRSLKMECTTADAAPAAGDVLYLFQVLESQDVTSTGKGTSDAQSLTLSFWVKSNVTGTFTGFLYDYDNTRMIAFDYSIASSGVWQKVTQTFAGDTTGAFGNDNGLGLGVFFGLAAGSNFTSGTLQTSWGADVAANRNVGQTNLAASTSNYWQVTGVQLEAGTVATSFEHKAYGTELLECQRYYYKHAEGPGVFVTNGANYTSSNFYGLISYPVIMRTNPSYVETNGTDYYVVYRGGGNDLINSFNDTSSPQAHMARFGATSGYTGTLGHGGWAQTYNANAYIAFDAEL